MDSLGVAAAHGGLLRDAEAAVGGFSAHLDVRFQARVAHDAGGLWVREEEAAAAVPAGCSEIVIEDDDENGGSAPADAVLANEGPPASAMRTTTTAPSPKFGRDRVDRRGRSSAFHHHLRLRREWPIRPRRCNNDPLSMPTTTPPRNSDEIVLSDEEEEVARSTTATASPLPKTKFLALYKYSTQTAIPRGELSIDRANPRSPSFMIYIQIVDVPGGSSRILQPDRTPPPSTNTRPRTARHPPPCAFHPYLSTQPQYPDEAHDAEGTRVG